MSHLSLEQLKLFDGQRFSTGSFFESISSGTAVYFMIENPVGSGKDILLDPILLSSTAEVKVQKLKNPTINATGTAQNIINKDFGSSRISIANVRENVTLTDRGEEFNEEVFGGGANAKVGDSANIGSDILREGTRLVIEVTSRASGVDVSIDSNYVEINT